MRTLSALIMLTSTMLLTDCVSIRSETPLYEQSQRVVDPSLEGMWAGCLELGDQSGELTLQVSAAPHHAYWLTLGGASIADDADVDDGDSHSPAICVDLVQLGDSLLAFPREGTPSGEDAAFHPLPCWRLTRRREWMTLDWINQDALAGAVRGHPEALKHDWIPGERPRDAHDGKPHSWPMGELVLCASAAEVQRFLLALQHDDALFIHVADLRKAPSP
jgi:hypothetical protein